MPLGINGMQIFLLFFFACALGFAIASFFFKGPDAMRRRIGVLAGCLTIALAATMCWQLENKIKRAHQLQPPPQPRAPSGLLPTSTERRGARFVH